MSAIRQFPAPCGFSVTQFPTPAITIPQGDADCGSGPGGADADRCSPCSSGLSGYLCAGGHADRTWDKRMRELIRPDVLILDDFAMRQMTAIQADDLYELVSERQGRSLIITSNRAPSDWHPLFPNPVVAESLLDRLINTSHQVIMNGPSYRPNKRPRNPTEKNGTATAKAR
ncbi:ATP-binding protein [Streptomyces sp. AGS-58]|uniref:ATP-binding protein n=1 Tax=unclassified Streptomyces TaxID=2593676 RepID=UPI0035A2B3C2